MERGFGTGVIRLVQGDITKESTDAIVNAANRSLLGGGGVDGAIHRAGGPAILEACKAIRARQGECPPGEAVVTTGGRLTAKHVIHTVGPVWRGGIRGSRGFSPHATGTRSGSPLRWGCGRSHFPRSARGPSDIR